MTHEAYESSENNRRSYHRVLDPYEKYVKTSLEAHPELSSSQIHDWLRERYPDLPQVDVRTVFNYTQYIKTKYGILKIPSLYT